MSDSPTELDLDALEKLAAEATPGPWRWWTSNSFRRLSSDATGKDGDVLHGDKMHDGVVDIVGSEADKAFIAAARTAVPALIERVRRAEAEHIRFVLMEAAAMAFRLRAEAAEARADLETLAARSAENRVRALEAALGRVLAWKDSDPVRGAFALAAAHGATVTAEFARGVDAMWTDARAALNGTDSGGAT